MRKTIFSYLLPSFLLISILAGFTHASAQTHRKDSIYALEKVDLGGVKQTILITGNDTSKPILLMLHGGPGFPELPFFRTYNKELDNDYIMVNWDQRGAGLSYSKDIPASTMTIEQMVSDAHDLVTLLKKRFHRDKIFVLGHSWGTCLGLFLVHSYPEDFYGYISVGQLVNMVQNERESLKYTIGEAKRTGNKKATQELSIIPKDYPLPDSISLDHLYTERKWLSFFGGVIHGQKDYSKVFNSITAPEYKLYDEQQTSKAEFFCMSNLWPQLVKVDFFKTAPELKVPVYFFVGRYDYNTPFSIAAEYYKQVKAPYKRLVWFEKSGHMMPFEETAKFNALVKEIAKRK